MGLIASSLFYLKKWLFFDYLNWYLLVWSVKYTKSGKICNLENYSIRIENGLNQGFWKKMIRIENGPNQGFWEIFQFVSEMDQIKGFEKK